MLELTPEAIISDLQSALCGDTKGAEFCYSSLHSKVSSFTHKMRCWTFSSFHIETNRHGSIFHPILNSMAGGDLICSSCLSAGAGICCHLLDLKLLSVHHKMRRRNIPKFNISITYRSSSNIISFLNFVLSFPVLSLWSAQSSVLFWFKT